MTAGFTFTASCPRCGGELLTEGFEPHIESPDLGHHDARCDRCCYVLRISVAVCVVEPWPVDLLDPEARHRERVDYADHILEGARIR